jgi:hypothetical protein
MPTKGSAALDIWGLTVFMASEFSGRKLSHLCRLPAASSHKHSGATRKWHPAGPSKPGKMRRLPAGLSRFYAAPRKRNPIRARVPRVLSNPHGAAEVLLKRLQGPVN